jgi:hypothetical protein
MVSDVQGAPDSEIEIMLATRKLIASLDPQVQRRVLLWLNDTFSVTPAAALGIVPRNEHRPTEVVQINETDAARPSSFAELLERTEPANNADRVLVAAFWLQDLEGRETLDGRSINKLLKEHGVDVSNVTNAFTSLIDRRPRLAMQAGKKGKFEKLYRLTTEGRKQVTALLSPQE